MSAANIVNLTINLKSKAPTQAGFGRPLIAAYHTHFLARTRLYTDPDGMLTDGFIATDQAYQDAVAIMSQNPAPPDFKIGRRALPFSQVVNLVPTVTTAGFVYSGTVEGTTSVDWTYTVLGGATVATISTALATLLGGLALGFTASGASTTWCACTTTVAGSIIRYLNTVPELHIADVTADPGIATDLASIIAADNDWFGLLLDSNSKAEVLAAAAYIEPKRKVFFYSTADYAAKDGSSTTDVMFLTKGLDYFSTLGLWHQDVGSLLAPGALALFLVTTPGNGILAHNEVVGVLASDTAPNGSPWLSDTEGAAVLAKNGNIYETLGSQGDLYGGTVAGGDFVDNVRFIDFMYARIQETMIGLVQAGIVKMTDKGIQKAVSTLLNLLLSWTKTPYEALDDSPANAPTVTAPTLAQIPKADLAIRKLPAMTFGCRLQGAIQLFDITGNVDI